VAGEAGIGKSRLLHEFRRALIEGGHRVTFLEGQCVSLASRSPFWPLIDQLRKNFRIKEYDGEPEIIAKVEHGMRLMGELQSHVPSSATCSPSILVIRLWERWTRRVGTGSCLPPCVHSRYAAPASSR